MTLKCALPHQGAHPPMVSIRHTCSIHHSCHVMRKTFCQRSITCDRHAPIPSQSYLASLSQSFTAVFCDHSLLGVLHESAIMGTESYVCQVVDVHVAWGTLLAGQFCHVICPEQPLLRMLNGAYKYASGSPLHHQTASSGRQQSDSIGPVEAVLPWWLLVTLNGQ